MSRLIASARWKHLHLDWIQPEQLAGQEPFLLAWEARQPVSALGCPLDPPEVAWIRVFAAASRVSLGESWEILWPTALRRLRQLEAQQAAALVSTDWMQPLLERSGFQLANEVIFLEHRQAGRLIRPQPAGRLRGMQPNDLEAVLAVDWSAFERLWRFSAETLREALSMSSRASLIEAEGVVIGYQITTESPFGAHLARLAVHPEWQGRGLGRALVADAMRWVQRRGLEVLSVNTQADNRTGRRLYGSLGFVETDQTFPVYLYPIQAD